MEAAQCLTLATSRRGDELVVRICGDLDLASIGTLLEAVEAAVDEHVRCCVLDCEEMTFIDSEGIKALLALHRRFGEEGIVLQVRNCSKQTRRLLALLGLEEYFGCASDNEPKQSV